LDEVKRNGMGVPRYIHPGREEEERTDIATLLQTYRELMYNLTSIERRIWILLLRRRSFDEVASRFGCSRSNIYCRIRGDGRGYGGMIAKNTNVAGWWARRQEQRIDSFEF
jgi:hypothetical protein